MTKTQYPTKYQITKLEQRVDEEIDPFINMAELELKSVLTEQTEIAMTYLSKKIKADKIINNLEMENFRLFPINENLVCIKKNIEIILKN